MLKKTWHFVLLVSVIVVALFVFHLLMHHQGQSVLPGVSV